MQSTLFVVNKDEWDTKSAVNETVCHALVSGGAPAVLEPVDVCHDDGKRPDGTWRQGLPLHWDFTCSDTLAPSNVSTSSRGASRLANSAESAKIKKYSSVTATFHFFPSVLKPSVLGGILCTFAGAAHRLPSHGADWRQ